MQQKYTAASTSWEWRTTATSWLVGSAARAAAAIALVAALVLVAGFVGVRALRTTTTEITAADAVDRFERSVPDESPASSTTTSTVPELVPVAIPLPAPGVYPVALSGGEQLDLATGADRIYPDEGFLTVTPSDCGVEFRTDFIVERWQTLELCSSGDGVELGTEQIYHQFFGLDDLVVRSCTDSSISADADLWRCESDASIAVRSVVAESAVREVAGVERPVVVFTTELLEGDHPDNVERIELWIDTDSGLPVYEARTYDFTLETPLGDAGYTESYEWTVASLEPIG